MNSKTLGLMLGMLAAVAVVGHADCPSGEQEVLDWEGDYSCGAVGDQQVLDGMNLSSPLPVDPTVIAAQTAAAVSAPSYSSVDVTATVDPVSVVTSQISYPLCPAGSSANAQGGCDFVTPGPAAGQAPTVAVNPAPDGLCYLTSSCGNVGDIALGAAPNPNSIIASLTPGIVSAASQYLQANGGNLRDAITLAMQNAGAYTQLSAGYLYTLATAVQSQLMYMGYSSYNWAAPIAGPLMQNGKMSN